MGYSDLGLIALDADAAHDDLFHSFGFFFHGCSWFVVEATADLEGHAEFFGEFYRARLHDLGAATRHLEHLVIGDGFDFFGCRDDTRVAGVDSVDVGEDLAGISLHSGGQRDGSEVRSAAPKGGDIPITRLSLESCHNYNLSCIKVLLDLVRGDVADLGLGMDAIGDNTSLRARE